MTTTHPKKSWREVYRAMRAYSPEQPNIARTPRLGLVEGRVDEFSGKQYSIYALCENELHCQGGVTYTVEEWLNILGADAKFSDMERRLRCSRCGQQIGGIRIISSHCNGF